jgi:polyphosphate kinase
MSVVQVPSVLPRLIEVEREKRRTFVFLEDVIASIAAIYSKAARL